MSVPFILNDCCLIPRGKDWAVFSLRESSFVGPSGPTDYPVWADSKEAAKEWVGESIPIRIAKLENLLLILNSRIDSLSQKLNR